MGEKGNGSSREAKTGRRADGTFAPGHSGNPGGRPRNKARELAEEALGTIDPVDIQEIQDTVIARAKAGDAQFVKLLWDRIAPATTTNENTYPEGIPREAPAIPDDAERNRQVAGLMTSLGEDGEAETTH